MFNDAIALLKGFWTTVKYTARPAVTIQYPDVKRTPADKFRGRHRLYKHEDGLERCIGCSLCAAACPSQAIYVRSAENDPNQPVSPGERYAEIYEINMIRCIFCGFCEEACPVDAIKLGPEYELADFDRKDFVYTKEMLLDPAKQRAEAPVPRRRRPLDGLARRPHDPRDGLPHPPPDRGAGPPAAHRRRGPRAGPGRRGARPGPGRRHAPATHEEAR